MKSLNLTPLAFAIVCIVAISCHKTKHTSASLTAPTSLISGLTAIRSQTYLDSNGLSMKNITWNFMGTGPIICAPATDTSYLGHEQVIFTGSNVTQINYYSNNSDPGAYFPITVNVTYTATNQIDTITFQFQNASLGARKYAFQYSGDHIIKVIGAFTVIGPDTLSWSTADLCYFTYSGNNISQILLSRYNSGTSSRDTETYYYNTDTRSNNFGGSLSTYLSILFPVGSVNLDYFLPEMPIYMNPNIVNGDIGGNYTVTTDNSGRITERIQSGDTTYYYY